MPGSGEATTTSGEAELWQTPVSDDRIDRERGKINSRGEPKLSGQVILWGTPRSSDAEQGFSHPVPETPRHGPTLSQLRRIWRPLRDSLIASHGRHVLRRLWTRRGKRRLNPLFVGWLMGWPIGHALCACSAMEFIHWQRHMRGALSALPTASGPWIWAPPNAAQKPVQIEMFGG